MDANLPRRTVSPTRDMSYGYRGSLGGASSPGPAHHAFTEPFKPPPDTQPVTGGVPGPTYFDPVYSHQIPAISRGGTPTHRPLPAPAPVQPVPHGPLVRTFSVLLVGDNNQKWYERDVSCGRAADLCGILQSRLGIPIDRVLYQGATLTDDHLSYVPDELKLELPSGPSGGRSPSAAYPQNGHHDVRKKQVTLLVEQEPRRVELDVASMQDLYSQLESMGYSGDVLLKRPQGDYNILLEPLQNLDHIDREQHVKVVPSSRPSRPYSPVSGTPHRNVSQSAAFNPHTAPHPPGFQNNPNNLRDPVDLQLVVVETGHMLLDHLTPPVDDAVVATATARVTQQFKQIHQTDDNGRPPNNTELAYLRNLAEQYLRVNGYLDPPALPRPPSSNSWARPPPQPQSQPPPQPPPPPQPAAPPPPPQPTTPPVAPSSRNSSGRDSVFKTLTFAIAGQFPQPPPYGTDVIQITPPTDTEQGKPVACLIATNEKRGIDIRCTLGYENEHGQTIVINLDEFYINQWVTLGHTSSNSLFLTFQPDVLRAGVRYFLDVTAWDAVDFQKIGNAQAEFTMSTLGEPLSVRRSRSASRPRGASTGRPSISARESILKPPYGFEDGQFQTQLREFLDNKVLPLYDLSHDPRFSEEMFVQVVNEACQEFWAYPPDTPFTEQHKKSILIQVKERLPR